MDWTNYEENWNKYKKGLVPRFLELGIIIFVIAVINPQSMLGFGFLMASTILFITLAKKIYHRAKIKTFEPVLLFTKSFILGCILFLMWANLKGWTIIIGVVAIAAWRMYQQRTFIKDAVQSGARLLEGKR